MWTYKSVSGQLSDDTGKLITVGYSGKGEGKNNPAMQDQHNVGPIPRGLYSISYMLPTTQLHGNQVLVLTPHPENTMFGRSGFLMHGDNIMHPGNASEGCIIIPMKVRENIWASPDHTLQVV